MGRYYDQAGAESCGRALVHQRGAAMDILKNNFEDSTLRYLQESILNYLLDNVALERNEVVKKIEYELNDFSFFIAPSYKALEGFLFQIAEDLELPSSALYDGAIKKEKSFSSYSIFFTTSFLSSATLSKR
jgi:hypothetical protein